jgi:hypothetical protein
MDEWDSLDIAAKANLGTVGFEKFLRFKKQLRANGHHWENDAQNILTGYIWDESEDSPQEWGK